MTKFKAFVNGFWEMFKFLGILTTAYSVINGIYYAIYDL